MISAEVIHMKYYESEKKRKRKKKKAKGKYPWLVKSR